VIGADDRPISGLYATGNGTATVMGRHYLGPGASIANTMVFGYVAARHATRRGGTEGRMSSETDEVER
jgi:3-oxosteroid 1-dehydrogenase